ncbi:MAG: 50S ribosomal protein L23 [Ectothiorhodospiraceae bacterium]|nr:50S ribosomal protein L23 [Ectothiorhodospiraceae bacterium]
MNQERIYSILLAPHVSEKTSVAAEAANQVVFKVARDATKDEIKQAVEQLFDVKVNRVQTAIVKGKAKNFGRIRGRRSDWKKAYVALEAGQEIDFLGGD